MNIIEWFAANVGKRVRFRWTFGGNPATGEFGQSCGSDDITADITANTCKTMSDGGASISIGHCYYCLSADEVAGSSCSESGAYAMVEAGSGNVFHCVAEVGSANDDENPESNAKPESVDTVSLFSAGSLIDQVAPFTALAVRDWLRNLRTAVDRCDRDEAVLAQRMLLVGFVKNLRLLGFESAADALAVDVGKMVGEHFASGASGGGYGLDWKSNGDCG